MNLLIRVVVVRFSRTLVQKKLNFFCAIILVRNKEAKTGYMP